MLSSDENHAGGADSAPPALDFKWTDLPGLLVLWLLAVIVFLQFFTRYVLNDSLAWTEEIARYVLIWVAFFGAISCSRKGTHIFLEFFYRYIPPSVGKFVTVLMELISCIFYSYLTVIAVQLALRTKTKMASAEIPKSLLYWGVAVSLGAMAIYSCVWLIRKYKQDPNQVMRELEERAVAEASD